MNIGRYACIEDDAKMCVPHLLTVWLYYCMYPYTMHMQL